MRPTTVSSCLSFRSAAEESALPPSPLPFSLVILTLSEAEGEESPHSAFALAVACPLVCHSAAQRRNPLFRPPFPFPLVILTLSEAEGEESPHSAFALALACPPPVCHSAAQRRNPLFRLCPCPFPLSF